MSSERTIEVVGENVEEAIANGLAELGVSPSDVIVEVLEEPSRGVLGLGARPARVRLKLFRTPAAAPAISVPPAPVIEEARAPYREERDPDKTDDSDLIALVEAQEVTGPVDEDAEVGKVVLGELLEKMDIVRAQVIIRRAEPSKPDENVPWLLDIKGGDQERLIGRRGETLAALQYVTRLITSREIQRQANIVVDVGGYKSRRAQMLHKLALRMAGEAIERQRVVTLEPMPPHERRIVHIALRDHEEVVTRSVGDGESRKVTIVPKSLA
jgi:spoIIIJ-associated protein